MSTWLSEDDARERLVRAVGLAGTADNLAAQIGCSPSLISRAVTGVGPVGPRIAQAIGLIAAPVKTYRYLAKDGQ